MQKPPRPVAREGCQRRPAGTKAPPDPIAARTSRDLGKLVGRSHVAVAGWLKRDDWPFGAGPWKASDVVRIQQWMESHLLDRPATADRARPADDADTLDKLSISKKADVALKMKRREVLAFGLEVQQGKYHLVEQCQRDRLAAIHEVKQGLLDLADAFPGSPEDKAILRGRVLELLRRFAGTSGVTSQGMEALRHE